MSNSRGNLGSIVELGCMRPRVCREHLRSASPWGGVHKVAFAPYRTPSLARFPVW